MFVELVPCVVLASADAWYLSRSDDVCMFVAKVLKDVALRWIFAKVCVMALRADKPCHRAVVVVLYEVVL